jgi:hypothetical protein
LREFRDRFLRTNYIGKFLVGLYQKYSPPLAAFIEKHEALRAVVRWSLLPFIGMSWLTLKLGPVPTLVLAVLMMALSVAALTILFRKLRLQAFKA